MIEYASSHNFIVGFNYASEDMYINNKQEILNIMGQSDFIFCNKDEAYAAAKYLGPELGLTKKDRG